MPQRPGRSASKVIRKSRSLIREVARDHRRRLSIDGQHVPDLNQVLIVFKSHFPHFKLKAIPDTRFPYMEAWVNCRTWTMYVRESVLEAIKYGNKRARFSIAHELGHLALGHTRSYFRRRPGAYVPPAVRTAEREANAFATEFLIPVHLAQKYRTAEEIAATFRVSLSAAKRRIRELRRELGPHHGNQDGAPVFQGQPNTPIRMLARPAELGVAPDSNVSDSASTVVFVAISFGPEKTRLYYEIIKPCVEELGLQSCRGDEVSGAGPVFDNLEKAISDCRLFVAEITNANPNVMNEIGIAQTRKKPIILISEAGHSNVEVPHNIRHITRIAYQNDAPGGAELRRQLRQLLLIHLNGSRERGDAGSV
jgi:Zn-dependent peptidase ImmA (M78 family)